MVMTKANILACLNEIGYRLVRTGEDNPQHYKDLCLAFSVAYFYVQSHSIDDVEDLADTIEELGLGQGSVQ